MPIFFETGLILVSSCVWKNINLIQACRYQYCLRVMQCVNKKGLNWNQVVNATGFCNKHALSTIKIPSIWKIVASANLI